MLPGRLRVGAHFNAFAEALSAFRRFADLTHERWRDLGRNPGELAPDVGHDNRNLIVREISLRRHDSLEQLAIDDAATGLSVKDDGNGIFRIPRQNRRAPQSRVHRPGQAVVMALCAGHAVDFFAFRQGLHRRSSRLGRAAGGRQEKTQKGGTGCLREAETTSTVPA